MILKFLTGNLKMFHCLKTISFHLAPSDSMAVSKLPGFQIALPNILNLLTFDSLANKWATINYTCGRWLVGVALVGSSGLIYQLITGCGLKAVFGAAAAVSTAMNTLSCCRV